jgi:hypothetical protein
VKILINYEQASIMKRFWFIASIQSPTNRNHNTRLRECNHIYPVPVYRDAMVRRDNGKLTLETCQAIARQRGGECTSTTWGGRNTPLTFKCARGHVWSARPVNVVYHASWCPKCAIAKRQTAMTIETMHAIAAERGGECLSFTYTSAHQKLEFRCARGHVWSATAWNVKNGSWCPRCAAPGGKEASSWVRGWQLREGEEMLIPCHQWYVTSRRPAKNLLIRRLDLASEAAAKLVATQLLWLHEGEDILPLHVPRSIIDGYMVGSTTGTTFLDAIYGIQRGFAMASVHVASGDVVGFIGMKRHEEDPAAAMVDFSIASRFRRREFVVPVWHQLTSMATRWLPPGTPPITSVRVGRYTPPSIHAVIIGSKGAGFKSTMRRYH